MSPLAWSAFVAVAAVGAPLRHVVSARWGTLVVNLTGSFVLGVLTALPDGGAARIVLGVGFCGAYTTFSAFAREVVALVRDGEQAVAARYVVATLAGGAAAAGAGLAVAALIR
jgi:CrcB protein